MINALYLKILDLVLFLVDRKNKHSVINYFKRNISGTITLIDVGAHKGETIKYFSKFLFTFLFYVIFSNIFDYYHRLVFGAINA